MSIIIKPIISEKMTKIDERINQVIENRKKKKTKKQNCVLRKYAFRVVRDANKIEIKKEIEALYNVSVIDVNTSIVKGKKKSRYTTAGMVTGSTPIYKKAVVTLKEGEAIDFYSNI
ncbi:MAG: 50S ribosomal protein L23 [Prevotellaceae bacterium]|jgi:large subunit ribosomal protein L23|nr:50S ribosomal protein L23 [Prevotellaceae bacterium]